MITELYLKAYLGGFTAALEVATEMVKEELEAAETQTDEVSEEPQTFSFKTSDAELAAQIKRIQRRGLI